MESIGRSFLFFCSLVCSFHLYLWSDTYFQQIPQWKKKLPPLLKPYAANGFHLSHNSPDNMTNCTKFILSLRPCSPFFGFPSNKWKSYPNAFEKKEKYIGRYSKLGERSQGFHKEKNQTQLGNLQDPTTTLRSPHRSNSFYPRYAQTLHKYVYSGVVAPLRITTFQGDCCTPSSPS